MREVRSNGHERWKYGNEGKWVWLCVDLWVWWYEVERTLKDGHRCMQDRDEYERW